jgi:DNA-binding beta-propeller fold protein YncE
VDEVLPNNTIKPLGSGFSFPSGVAVDSAGNVFVADSGNSAVKEIKTDGSIHVLGSGFDDPQGIAVNPTGGVIVADTFHNAVKEILPSGAIIPLGSGLSGPFSVAVDALADVFVGDENNSRAVKLSFATVTSSTLTGSSAASITDSLTGLKSKTKYFYRAVAVSAAGTILGQIKSFTTA